MFAKSSRLTVANFQNHETRTISRSYELVNSSRQPELWDSKNYTNYTKIIIMRDLHIKRDYQLIPNK